VKKFWRVFVHEYLRHVLRKRFLFAVLSLPLILLVVGAFTLLMVALQYDSRPVGFVDLAGWLEKPVYDPVDPGRWFADVPVVKFPTVDAARIALAQEQIQGVYVFSENYLETGEVSLIAVQTPSEGAKSAFNSFVRENLVRNLPESVRRRLLDGDTLDIRTLDGSRQSGNGRWIEIAIPLAAGVLFMFVVNMTGGYLLRAVVEEKENRTMEIVITSVSPTQLMAGKISGNLCVGLSQLVLWLAVPLAALGIAAGFFPSLQGVRLFTPAVWLTLVALLPAFVMISALMAAVGATATESSEASAVAGWFTLPLVIPYWFISVLMENPNSPLSIALSLFPLTAPVTLPVRMAFTTVSAWQITLSIGLLYACAAGAMLLAGRAFRMGMLRYGKRLSFRELFGKERKTA